MMDMYALAAMAMAGFDGSISSVMQAYKAGANKTKVAQRNEIEESVLFLQTEYPCRVP